MKRGVSTVVAIILIILITIGGVIILWNVVIPMIKEDISFEGELVELSINFLEGYTVWDEDTQSMSVHIKRGIDDFNLSGIQFVFSKDGNSETYISDEVPDKNEMKVYNFGLTALGGKPDSVSIAPIFIKGDVETMGIVTDTVKKWDVPWGEVTQEGIIVIGAEYVCTDTRARDYCASFSGFESENAGTNCINAGCIPYGGWCSGADINKNGSVGSEDLRIIMEEEWGRGCDLNLPPPEYRECIEGGNACSFDNGWCNGADISGDGFADDVDSARVLTHYLKTECGLQENIFEDCRFVSSCFATSKSRCENVKGCLWINPSLSSCENPLMQATWSSSSGIRANNAFDGGESHNSFFLNVVELDRDYVLNATGVWGVHVYEKAVIKSLDNLQSWGGTVYVNLNEIVYPNPTVRCNPGTMSPCPTDIVFIGGYTYGGWDRDLGIAAAYHGNYNYIYMAPLYHTCRAGSLARQRFGVAGSNVDYPAYVESPWPDRWIKIEWAFGPNYEFYGKIDDGAWKKIPVGSTKGSFKRFALGLVSSFDGGSVYFKNITLYPPECIPNWMTHQY